MSRVTVVVDNLVNHVSPLFGEHGLSLWVEHQGHNILYDTGMGRALLPNLESLGLDPNRLEALVLSHGHYDHTGGLEALLGARKEALPVYCHAGVFDPHLADHQGQRREVGPPLTQMAYESLGARFNFVERWADPWPGITLLADIPRQTDYEVPAPALITVRDGQVSPDPFTDDLAMLIQGTERNAVLTGCAHSGVINVLMDAEQKVDGPVDLLVGGTHLGPAPQAQQKAALAELATRGTLEVAAGHCTGPIMAGRLHQALGERFSYLGVGTVLEV
ncbi:MAG: MBL fold metallo-hydrolase [Deltaproteobacteria bacterium]|nr:MBL fold metallo-hydrolase [Deltaproteobacteria bacterium]